MTIQFVTLSTVLMLQAIYLHLVGRPLFPIDVSKMTAISLADSSSASEIGAGAILIGLHLVGCVVFGESVHTETSELNIHRGTWVISIWYSSVWIALETF